MVNHRPGGSELFLYRHFKFKAEFPDGNIVTSSSNDFGPTEPVPENDFYASKIDIWTDCY